MPVYSSTQFHINLYLLSILGRKILLIVVCYQISTRLLYRDFISGIVMFWSFAIHIFLALSNLLLRVTLPSFDTKLNLCFLSCY